MAYGTNPQEKYSYRVVTDMNRQRFQEALGLPTTDAPSLPALTENNVGAQPKATEQFATMGQAIRENLSEPLDEKLIATELTGITAAFNRLPDLRTSGIPARGETPYEELTPSAWRLTEHLEEVGFFASAEETLPAFTPEHITTATRQLLTQDDLTETLADLGFTDDEQVALITNIITAREQLSWWERTIEYPPVESQEEHEEGVVYDTVPPLHERAMAGSLLWIDGLDWWLWQQEVLITDEMIDNALWDIKSMLAGIYLLGKATLGLAKGTIADEDVATVTTASTAMMIIGQEYLAEDIAWIDDQMRKPRAATYEGINRNS
ncbi:hypothetical protein [Natrialba sp. SSL1]|uniref:hypothetical protein n=1 Tax=Natrialba sp. SSL1 TaxID=1869245 RepID=UPI0008F8DB72|nr:hypothetical protein [Natrialba sp. SSL1]OIB58088.1 hypothetical protein BBD46_10535 [Natrialba sp. SSL1]